MNGDLLENGPLVPKHVEEVKNIEEEKLPYQIQMEVNLVKEMRRKNNHVKRQPARSTVNGDLMVNGQLAPRHVEEERNLAQEKWLNNKKTEGQLVKDEKKKNNLVIRQPVQWTVNGDHMAIGQLAPGHAEEGRNLARERWPRNKKTEVRLVKEMKRKNNLVIRQPARSTVNGDLMENGQLAPRHAE